MITIFKDRHSGWIAGIQAPWMALSLPSMALYTRFPAGMTSFLIILINHQDHEVSILVFSS
jgi:hypothetical protein